MFLQRNSIKLMRFCNWIFVNMSFGFFKKIVVLMRGEFKEHFEYTFCSAAAACQRVLSNVWRQVWAILSSITLMPQHSSWKKYFRWNCVVRSNIKSRLRNRASAAGARNKQKVNLKLSKYRVKHTWFVRGR